MRRSARSCSTRSTASASWTPRRRRDQHAHPAYARPELLAAAPNQVWSWDIPKLKGPAKWTCFHLYVILDIFSRCVVGWLIALHDRDILVTACGRICMHRKKIYISTVLAGQKLGVKEVDEGIWLVSFMHYDLGYIDLEQKTLQPLDNPFGARLLPMS